MQLFVVASQTSLLASCMLLREFRLLNETISLPSLADLWRSDCTVEETLRQGAGNEESCWKGLSQLSTIVLRASIP